MNSNLSLNSSNSKYQHSNSLVYNNRSLNSIYSSTNTYKQMYQSYSTGHGKKPLEEEKEEITKQDVEDVDDLLKDVDEKKEEEDDEPLTDGKQKDTQQKDVKSDTQQKQAPTTPFTSKTKAEKTTSSASSSSAKEKQEQQKKQQKEKKEKEEEDEEEEEEEVIEQVKDKDKDEIDKDMERIEHMGAANLVYKSFTLAFFVLLGVGIKRIFDAFFGEGDENSSGGLLGEQYDHNAVIRDIYSNELKPHIDEGHPDFIKIVPKGTIYTSERLAHFNKVANVTTIMIPILQKKTHLLLAYINIDIVKEGQYMRVANFFVDAVNGFHYDFPLPETKYDTMNPKYYEHIFKHMNAQKEKEAKKNSDAEAELQ
ncbi:PA14 domain-containing protein [Tieghemostelium lacteum]|uniref:PA14 domain-containing protein n=1 Tax=Tieghemostelium lacteum TaxID=361077 RepID=A0A151ZAH2_TIELA|nr:PA14 domain-containing protein [Tieghemostelium lacteum]|eukprot:KYQ90952.1 PA14 domain-containing protein [Tieghemostelium lacteum]